MARRLALLAMLLAATAAAAANTAPRPPPRSDEYSDSQSLESYPFWDYEESRETTTPKLRTYSAIVPKNKNPKFNVTMKNNKSENQKKVIKTTNINIETHTQFVVTKKPATWSKPGWAGHPVVKVDGEYVLLDVPMPVVAQGGGSARPSTPRPGGGGTRKPQRATRPTPRPPARPPARPTARPTPRPKPRSTTRRKQPSTTKRSTTARPKRRPIKPTKATITKTTCKPNKKPGWLSSFFKNNKTQKETKKPPKSWFTGFFSKVYNWIYRSIWTGESWFSDPAPPAPTTTTTTTTTTTEAPFVSTNNWFESFLESEENDVTFASNPDLGTKKSMKKSVKRNYKGYQLLRAYPDMQWKVHEMLELQEDGDGSGLMWWTAPSMNGSTDLLVPPDLLPDVKDHLKSSKIDYDVVIWDLHKAIMYENPRLSKKQRLELEHLRGHPMTWRRYHRYADILRYLEYLHHSHADLVELIPLGRSSEGLPLVAVKISMPSNDTNTKDSTNKAPNKKYKLRSKMKPAVWIDGGMHAREWIAPAVATWIIQTLVEGEKGLGPETEALKQADFFILPLLNPDGYEHSHTHDRLWKKTRSRPAEHSDNYFNGWFPWSWGQTDCVGVDVDRNWDYHWSEKDSSREPCSDNYAGPHPFSEPETRAVSEFLLENRGQIKVYVSLHAYSQAWLLPSTHAHAPFSDDGVLMEMGKLATAALADMYGTKYQVGTAAEIRQPASGMSHDWAKARAGIKFSYHVDLRDSYGPYGFLLPGSQIVSTARETWQAIKTIVDNLAPG